MLLVEDWWSSWDQLFAMIHRRLKSTWIKSIIIIVGDYDGYLLPYLADAEWVESHRELSVRLGKLLLWTQVKGFYLPYMNSTNHLSSWVILGPGISQIVPSLP